MDRLARREPEEPLGLIPFLVPGWPSREVFMRLVDAIARIGCAGWEIAIPSGGWSPATSGTIAAALSQSRMALADVLSMAQDLRPNVAVLYPRSIEENGRDRLLDQLLGRFDHIMLEAADDHRTAWIECCARRGLGWVEVRNAASLDAEAAKLLADGLPQSSVLYLTAASAPGETVGSFAPLEAAVAAIRSQRGDCVVTTGFGISTPEHVERLAAIEGLDAVAIGTALLQHLAQGPHKAAAYYVRLHESAGKAILDAVS